MDLGELSRSAFDSVRGHKLRSFLTLLGIIIGVTAIISVISVINGLNLYVEEKLITLGPASFQVERFGIIKNRKDFFEALRRNPALRYSDAEAVRQGAALAELVGVKVGSGGSVRRGSKTLSSVEIRGITPEILIIEPYEVHSGRGISQDEDKRAAAVAFLGFDVARALFGSVDALGRDVKIGGRSYEVVGVAEQQGSIFGHSRDNYVAIPLGTFRKQYGQRDSVSIVVRARNAALIEDAMDEARVVLRARHHLRHDEADDFGIVSAEALTTLWKTLSKTLFQVAIFVVGISLVVGGIVIMNIMLVSVIERTREIGVRKAVGARHRDIERQFVIESAVLSAAGGVVGIAISFAASWAVSSYSPLPAVYPWWAPVLAVGISSTIGIFFGIYPARKAARLNPIDALRSEG
jgi:putative ABC transport system permease protein